MSQDQEINESETNDEIESPQPKGPPPKVNKSGAFAIGGRAFRAMLENMFVLLALISLSAYVDAALLQGVFEANGVNDLKEAMSGGAAAGQSQLISVVLTWTGLHLLKVIYLWQH